MAVFGRKNWSTPFLLLTLHCQKEGKARQRARQAKPLLRQPNTDTRQANTDTRQPNTRDY